MAVTQADIDNLKAKRDKLSELLELKHGLIKKLGDPTSDEQYKRLRGTIAELVKDIAEEVKHIDSEVRKARLTDWPRWWNVWVGGLVAALLWDVGEIVIDLIGSLLDTLNNPEELLKLLEKLIPALEKLIS